MVRRDAKAKRIRRDRATAQKLRYKTVYDTDPPRYLDFWWSGIGTWRA